MAMLALGFLTARVTPASFLGNFHSAGMVEPATSRVRYVEPVSPGECRLWWMKPGSACFRAAWMTRPFNACC